MTMLTELQARRIAAEVNHIQPIQQLGIVFEGQGQCRLIRESDMPVGLRTWIVLKEIDDPVATAGTPKTIPRDSHVGRELVNLGLSCGSAVLSGLAVAGGVGAAPLTAGASTTLTVLAWSSLVAGSVQCANSGWRVFNELVDPSKNDQLDSQRWYVVTSDILDAVSVAGGIAGLGQAAQAAIRLGRTSGRPLTQILRGMTRAERKRLAQDVAKYAGDATTRRQFIRLARQGRVPKVFTRTQVQSAVLSQTLNSIGNGLSLAGSGAFGVIRKVAVYYVEEQ
jgi:hypothetical protein